MSDLLITTRAELHQKLMSLPASAFGADHATCLIGRACQALYGRTSNSFYESGYPVDVAKAIAEWNDRLPQYRQALIPLLPHPSETPELTTDVQRVVLALWAARRILTFDPAHRDETEKALSQIEGWLAGGALDVPALHATIALFDGERDCEARAVIAALYAAIALARLDSGLCRLEADNAVGHGAHAAVRDGRDNDTEMVAATAWLTEYLIVRAAIIAQYPKGVSL